MVQYIHFRILKFPDIIIRIINVNPQQIYLQIYHDIAYTWSISNSIYKHFSNQLSKYTEHSGCHQGILDDLLKALNKSAAQAPLAHYDLAMAETGLGWWPDDGSISWQKMLWW